MRPSDVIFDHTSASWMTFKTSGGVCLRVIIPVARTFEAPLTRILPAMQTNVVVSADDMHGKSCTALRLCIGSDRSVDNLVGLIHDEIFDEVRRVFLRVENRAYNLPHAFCIKISVEDSETDADAPVDAALSRAARFNNIVVIMPKDRSKKRHCFIFRH